MQRDNKPSLLTSFIKMFKRVKITCSTMIAKIKSNIILKTIKRKINIKTFGFDKLLSNITNVSLKKIVGEEDKEAEQVVKQNLRKIRKNIAALKMAARIFFEIPLVVKDDFRKYIKHIKDSLPRMIYVFIDIYKKITKFIYFKFFALIRIKRTLIKNHSLQQLASALYQLLRKISITAIDILFFVIYKTCCSIQKTMTKNLVATVGCLLILVLILIIAI